MNIFYKLWPTIASFIILIMFVISVYKKSNAKKIKFNEASYLIVNAVIIYVIIAIANFINIVWFDMTQISFVIAAIIIFKEFYRLSTKSSLKDEEVKKLIQRNALLEKRIREIEKKLNKEGK